MNLKPIVKIILLTIFSSTAFGQSKPEEQHHWGDIFSKHEAKGTILIVDKRKSFTKKMVFNAVRAKQRFAPASTFKLPHTLFALDSGLIKDEFQVFQWDGVKRSFEPHNRDQDLRSAIRFSALWVYENFARKIGEDKARGYLKKIHYGNMNPSTEAGAYWVEGKLAINAYEQIDFLERLFLNTLPFNKEHQRLLKDVMITEAGNNWILRAKTGWDGRYGWWVGWVEWPEGPVYFVLNIDTPNRMKDLYKRKAIVKEILTSIQALPSNK